MNTSNKFFFILLFFISFKSNAFGQIRYFLKLFESNDKKYIILIEKEYGDGKEIAHIEDEKAFNDYKKKLKEERKTEIAIPGIFKTRKEFLDLNYNAIGGDSRKKAIEILASGPKGGVDDIHAGNAFPKAGLLSPGLPPKKTSNKALSLSRERNSLINVKKSQVYISIPESPDEFKNIFDTPDNQQLNDCIGIKKRICNEKNINVHFVTSSDLLTNGIINSPDDMPIILIGHNEDGEFRLPDGSRKKFEHMDSLANVAKRSIIYLSCNADIFTNSPSANFYLTYHDGIAITNRINNALLKDGNFLSNETITNILEVYGKEKKLKLKYKITIYTISVSGLGYTLYEIKDRR